MLKVNKNLIPIEGDRFKFRCYKEISCFTECCAKLDLLLTPYDVLRAKKRLRIDSEKFLDIYTDINPLEYPPFPILKLKMRDDGRCPFVTPDGCSIYKDRPSACRLYPLARASMMVGHNKKEKFFIIKEKHCLGFNEKREWSLNEWLRHEEVTVYDKFNIPWFKIITLYSASQPESEEKLFKKMQMFFMASYNLDKFKKFIFGSKFFDLYDIALSIREKIFHDDESLLSFAFEWLNLFLYGKKSSLIRFKSKGRCQV